MKKVISEVRSKMVKPKKVDRKGFANNFVIGDCILDIKCKYGHAVRGFNVRKSNYLACDECRTYTLYGINLHSSWTRENDAIWEANCQSVEGYKRV